MGAEARVVAAGAVLAATLLAGHGMLLPAPPGPELRPRADSLEGLTPYLAADTAAPPVASAGAAAGAARATGAIRLARDPFLPGNPGGRDPDAGERPGPGAREGWSVSAIMISGDRRLAIVDDRVVEAGDTLAGGARVVDVARDHVTVLGPDGVRRRVALNR